MNILCALFGHRPAFGYGHVEGQGYASLKNHHADGLGTIHADVVTDCERCGKIYTACKVHLPGRHHAYEIQVGDSHNGELVPGSIVKIQNKPTVYSNVKKQEDLQPGDTVNFVNPISGGISLGTIKRIIR